MGNHFPMSFHAHHATRSEINDTARLARPRWGGDCIPHKTSPLMSITLFFHCPASSVHVSFHASQRIGTSQAHESAESRKGGNEKNGRSWPQAERLTRPPASSSHSFILSTLDATELTSFSVSPGATAAKTSTPLPIDEMTSLSTVTEADSTRWMMAS